MAWANVNFDKLIEFFQENYNLGITPNYPQRHDKQSVLHDIKTSLEEIILESDESQNEKQQLMEKLNICFTRAINQFDGFFSKANNSTNRSKCC